LMVISRVYVVRRRLTLTLLGLVRSRGMSSEFRTRVLAYGSHEAFELLEKKV
jgi:hypothetical protein